jgi:hypothetical protein
MEQQICVKQPELFSISCWKTKAMTTKIWKVKHNIEGFIGDGAGMIKAGDEAL